MKKLNNKGFTLIEVLAVVVILSVLIAIMVPSVNHLIEKNKEDNYQSLKSGMIQATKVLFSDYRYEVSVNGSCSDLVTELDIQKVGSYILANPSKIPIHVLVDEENITTDQDGNIFNPKDKTKKLDLDESYVLVKYQCDTKDFRYQIEETKDGEIVDYLKWK